MDWWTAPPRVDAPDEMPAHTDRIVDHVVLSDVVPDRPEISTGKPKRPYFPCEC